MEVKSQEVLRFDGAWREEKRLLVRESDLSLRLGSEVLSLNVTMEDIEDFVHGFLFTSGRLAGPYEIKNISIDGTVAHVDLGEGEGFVPSPSSYRPSMEVLMKVINDFNQPTELFAATRAVHSCALYDCQGRRVLVRNDIGRHNAMDKVIGAILREKIDIKDKFIYISGRLPELMVAKAAKIGVKTLVTLAKATDRGLNLAKDKDMTLIGETRKPYAFTLYNGPMPD